MNPKIYKRSEKDPTIRKCGINKNISLFFKYFPDKQEVILLSFWNNRRNPKDFKILTASVKTNVTDNNRYVLYRPQYSYTR